MLEAGHFGEIPDGADMIETKKKVAKFLKEVRDESKPSRCIVCGRLQSSFCNSHSVPRMVLKNIAENGNVLQANALVGMEIIDTEKGVNNSGTFQFICRECDASLFKDYENQDNLLAQPIDNKIIAEIVLKDTLVMLSKRNQEKVIYSKGAKMGKIDGVENMIETQELDEREYRDEMQLYMELINNCNDSFNVVYHTILPYVVPIATQTIIAMQKDLEGVEINNLYDFSPAIRIQNIHIAVFPLEDSTVVVMFYHKRDRKYRKFWRQMNSISEGRRLEIINYLIFKYSENYYLAPSIKETIEHDEKLVQLSREYNEMPNLGYILSNTMISEYKPVQCDEIPNFLDIKYALR